jgi:rhamnose utilization protein RhaD (predicted bifunctional aldolase and dehydrogenase)
MLDKITELSHEFGTSEYIQGGGGNSSVKNKETLWIKPSGTTMADLTRDMFVAIDRAKLAKIYDAKLPAETSARESMVNEMMMAAMYPYSSGRPSVESLLHDSFAASYVMHTHPQLVNGMACAKNGAELCRRLFPEAMWAEYVDPGYTLSIAVRKQIKDYVVRTGKESEVVIIENHGIFVACDSAQGVKRTYKNLMSRLRKEYKKENVSTILKMGLPPSDAVKKEMAETLKRLMGAEAAVMCASGRFKVAEGPLTPDHVVFMKSYPFVGDPTPKTISAFKSKNGYFPRVISTKTGVFTVGTNERNADVTMKLAKDGALVEQLAGAFGGVKYMNEKARIFIENWEMEVYRQKVVAGQA